MKTYTEVLGIIKKADWRSEAIERARRARQLVRQNAAQNTQTQAEAPVAKTRFPSFKQRRDAQYKKQYGMSYGDFQRQADRRFNDRQYRNAVRDIQRGKADSRMLYEDNKDDAAWDQRMQQAQLAYKNKETQIGKRNYDNPTWEQAMAQYGSKAGASRQTPQQAAFRNKLTKQLYSANMSSSNPETARNAALTAMREKDPQLASWGHEEAKKRDLAPTLQQMPEHINPEVAQKVYAQGYTGPSNAAQPAPQTAEAQIRYPDQQQAAAQGIQAQTGSAVQPAPVQNKQTYAQQLNGSTSPQANIEAPVQTPQQVANKQPQAQSAAAAAPATQTAPTQKPPVYNTYQINNEGRAEVVAEPAGTAHQQTRFAAPAPAKNRIKMTTTQAKTFNQRPGMVPISTPGGGKIWVTQQAYANMQRNKQNTSYATIAQSPRKRPSYQQANTYASRFRRKPRTWTVRAI